MVAKDKIRILQSDITQSDAEAIVSDGNTELWLGSGVALAIAKAGGPSIQKECQTAAPVSLGEVVVTKAGDLKAKHVFHAASMDFDEPTAEEVLYDNIKNSLLRAEELQIRTLAIPAIGVGVGGFDPARCAEIMLGEILHRLGGIPSLERVDIVLLDPEVFEIFKSEYDKL